MNLTKKLTKIHTKLIKRKNNLSNFSQLFSDDFFSPKNVDFSDAQIKKIKKGVEKTRKEIATLVNQFSELRINSSANGEERPKDVLMLFSNISDEIKWIDYYNNIIDEKLYGKKIERKENLVAEKPEEVNIKQPEMAKTNTSTKTSNNQNANKKPIKNHELRDKNIRDLFGPDADSIIAMENELENINTELEKLFPGFSKLSKKIEEEQYAKEMVEEKAYRKQFYDKNPNAFIFDESSHDLIEEIVGKNPMSFKDVVLGYPRRTYDENKVDNVNDMLLEFHYEQCLGSAAKSILKARDEQIAKAKKENRVDDIPKIKEETEKVYNDFLNKYKQEIKNFREKIGKQGRSLTRKPHSPSLDFHERMISEEINKLDEKDLKGKNKQNNNDNKQNNKNDNKKDDGKDDRGDKDDK